MNLALDKGLFRPALLVVDMQEDFCPPSGSLAVAGGRDIAPTINELLSLPFIIKVATKDCHPVNHISFAVSHEPPNNKPFESFGVISNPSRDSQYYDIPLWPVHCVQGTKGAEIIPEIEISKLDEIVEKGRDKRIEMFSGFLDVFGGKSTESASLDLAGLLRGKNISHVYIVGIAGDFCVKCTALDAKNEGFEVYAVDEAIRSVDPGNSGWGAAKKEMDEAGIRIVSARGPEISKVKDL
ncbi:MAG: hypothetical protein Q9217_001497 [Psora testacea]